MTFLILILLLGLLNFAVIYLISSVLFRLKGRTLVSKIEVGGKANNLVKKRTQNLVILLNLLILIVTFLFLSLLIYWLFKNYHQAIVDPLIFIAVIMIIVDVVGIKLMAYLSKLTK